MEKRNYYFLVSGLPDLVPEQSKIPFTLPEFVEMLQEGLHPDDFQEATWLLYPVDHHNVPALLQKRDFSWKVLEAFSRDALEESLREPGRLPAYVEKFYQAYRNDAPIWPQMSWENQLTRLYFEASLENTRGFLRQWLIFDNQLRNILAAWNIREYRLSAEGQLIGQNEVTHAVDKSHARDFGLSGELPFLDKLLYAMEQDNLLECEKAIERIKWNYIDELNTFEYFTIDVILGYLIKLMMLERWMILDAEGGKVAIDGLIEDLENSFDFPVNFDIA